MRYFFLLLLSMPGFAQTGPPTSQTRLAKRLDSLCHSYPADAPGFVFSIEKRGDIIYRNAVGVSAMSDGAAGGSRGSSAEGSRADKAGSLLDTLSNFRMASVTKQFTAMGIFLLEKEGVLSFDDPLGRWLPELPASVSGKVLIRHLLTHTSGVLDYEYLIPDSQTRQVLDADVLKLLSTHDSTYFPPGAKFNYSNSGFCLLALIIERASHQTFATFIKEKIFAPLHMDHSAIYAEGHSIDHRAMGYAKDTAGRIYPSDQSVTSATKGDGGVYTSVTDYSKWMHALQENRLIKLRSVLRRLQSPIAGAPDSYYAGGWFITGSSPVILFHSGSTCGFANFVIQLPGDEWSIFYFSNLAGNDAPFRAAVHILQQEGVEDFSSVFKLHDLTK